MTTDDETRELLAAYALDAVDDVERRAVERLLERDADAAREVAGYAATAAMLGSASVARPPVGLRDDVLAAISRTPQVGVAPDAAPHGRAPSAPVVPVAPDASGATSDAPAGPVASAPVSLGQARAARASRRPMTWLAVAATAVGAAVVPSALAVHQAQRGDRAEQQAQAIAELLADPDATVVRGEVTGGGSAVGVLADDAALFTATGLAEPAEGRVYQLWVLRDGEALPDALLDDADDGGAGTVRALTAGYREGDGLAVTLEPAGGSEAPTTDPVVVLLPTEA